MYGEKKSREHKREESNEQKKSRRHMKPLPGKNQNISHTLIFKIKTKRGEMKRQ